MSFSPVSANTPIMTFEDKSKDFRRDIQDEAKTKPLSAYCRPVKVREVKPEIIPVEFSDMGFEEKINYVENCLSLYSAIPFIGTPIGVSKVALGFVQTVSSIALVILTSIPAVFQNEDSKKLFFRACKHIPHGIGNIIAGYFEAIPIAGSIYVGIRFLKVHKAGWVDALTNEYQMMEHPKFKFYAYENNTVENSAYWTEQIERFHNYYGKDRPYNT